MRNHEEKESSEIQASAFTCEICLESKPSCQKFEHTNNYFVHNFCMSCVTRHIQAKLEETISTINCPELTCHQILDPIDCRAKIPPRLFTQWCDCLCRSVVSGSEKCYCPYMDCSEVVLNECNETVKRCLCPGCKRPFCYACRVPWHAGYWCSESHQARDYNERRFGFLLERMKWTRCPDCGQPVERISGCRDVICRCGRLFCHDCGSSPHLGDCRHPTSRYCRERLPVWSWFCIIMTYGVFWVFLLCFLRSGKI